MGLLSRKPGRVRQQAMPVGISIVWKPIRDSHYVIASLQPGGAGLRQICVRQSTLREVQALTRNDPERLIVGLLLGHRLDCPLTLTPYVLIESHAEVALASLDEVTVADAIRSLRGRVDQRSSAEVLGWFCVSRSADTALSRAHTAVHAACFTEPWQTVLILGDGGDRGAFFLHDSRAARWFQTPFYEVANSKESGPPPRPTCVTWPAYLTTTPVVPLIETPQPASVPVASTASDQTVAPARPIVRMRRTPTRQAIIGAGRAAAVSARRSSLEFIKMLGGHAMALSRDATRRTVRIHKQWAESRAQRKAEADAARAREEERRLRDAARHRAAREESQRRAAEAAKQRAAEVEARRVAELEARRKAAEEAERRRAVEAEARRQAAEAEARRRADEAEARRVAELEAQRRAADAARRKAAEAEAQRQAAEEAQRRAEEEAQRKAAEAAERHRAVEAEARRQAAEAEARRLADEMEAREAAEAEAQRLAAEEAEEEARRLAAEAEEDARAKAEEAEALRISVEVAAIRARLARAPVEVEEVSPWAHRRDEQ